MIKYNITPVPKPRMTKSDKWKKRDCVLRYWDFKDQINLASITLSNQLSVTFVIHMPESWSKKKKTEMDGKPHEQKPDLDNLVKALQDACLKDDSRIHTYNNIKKVWGYSGAIIL